MTGEEALEQMRQHSNNYFDYVFMDLHMPLMDGFGLMATKNLFGNRKKMVIPTFIASAKMAKKKA